LQGEAAEKLLQAWDRQLAYTRARRAGALARAVGPAPARGEDWAAETVSIVLRVSPGIAHREVDIARALAGPLQPLSAALERARMLTALPAQATAGWWRRRLRREVLRADTADAITTAGPPTRTTPAHPASDTAA